MNKYFLTVLTVLLFCNTQKINAQKKKQTELLYLYDANWKNTTDTKNAAYIEHIKQVNDTCWQWDTYNFSGPMIRSERTKDADGNIMHGTSYYLNAKGSMDSTRSFANNLAHGTWYYYNDTGKAILQKDYENGRIVKVVDILKEDSIKKASGATQEKEEGIHAVFPGGIKGWMNFLLKNMQYPERAVKGEITGKVYVFFMADKEGNVTDPRIFRSVEYSLDEEALRIIRKSPKWEPAIKNGKQVNMYMLQPIVFALQ